MSAFWRPWPKESELGQGAYQVVLKGRLRLYGRGTGVGAVNALDTWRRERVNERP